MTPNALGNYVRERRQDLNLSQEQLADRVGGSCCQSDVSRIERGLVKLPRLSTMISLAAALEVSVGNLLIATGWFQHGHFEAAPGRRVSPAESPIHGALAEIDNELAVIGDLGRQAAARSQELLRMIRAMKATAKVPGSLIAAD